MREIELKIVDGPDKPDLQWAIAYPERDLHVHFRTDADAIDARLEHMDELGDGTHFGLVGHLASGLYNGWPFRAIYHIASRSGVIKTREPD